MSANHVVLYSIRHGTGDFYIKDGNVNESKCGLY